MYWGRRHITSSLYVGDGNALFRRRDLARQGHVTGIADYKVESLSLLAPTPDAVFTCSVLPSRDQRSESSGLDESSDCNVLYRDKLSLETPRTRAASAAALVPFRIPVIWSTRFDHRSLMSVSQSMPLVDGAASGAGVGGGSAACGGNIVGCGGTGD